MHEGMIAIATYSDKMSAEMAKGQLEAAGITALIHADDGGGMRPDLDMTIGVRLLVPADAVDTAKQILQKNADQTDSPAWTCTCGEHIEAGFDICWNCGRERD